MRTTEHIAGVGFLALAVGLLFLLPVLPARSQVTFDIDTLEGVEQRSALLFAGFPGCSAVCPTALSVMAQTHSELTDKPALVFINVQRDANPRAVQRYAEAFSDRFITGSIDEDSAAQFLSELGIASFPNQFDAVAHRGSVYVLEKVAGQWRIFDIYERTPSTATLAATLTKLHSS